MILEQRLDIIVNNLKKEGTVSNRDLADRLGVSESTLRRDLSLLEKEGKLMRVHGGATLKIEASEMNYMENEKAHPEAKLRIARKAGQLVGESHFLFLDAGSTCHQLIDYLDPGSDLTIVTNGLMHVEKLIRKGIRTLLLEGQIKPSTRITTGAKTVASLRAYNFDLAFIGVNGYDEQAYYTADVNEAMLKTVAIRQARRAYVLADSSKEGIRYFASIARRTEAELITEEEA